MYCQSIMMSAQVSPHIPLDSVLRLGLPVVEIMTVNGEEPTAEEAVKPDKRCSGRTITPMNEQRTNKERNKRK